MEDKDFERIYRESNQLLSFKEIYFEYNVKPLFEQVLKEMEVNQVRSIAPVKIDGTIDYQYLKTDWNIEKMQEFVSARKNIYCGYALVDVKIDKLFKTA